MMRSESTSALGQPRETIPTLGAGLFMGRTIQEQGLFMEGKSSVLEGTLRGGAG
jgi:hypothetical protein